MRPRSWLPILILLLAFSLRLASLERRPLHFDEGNNVFFGLRAPHLLQDSIEHSEADPPLHRALLGGWMALAGTSPFAIRFLSVGWGVLAVALANQLGRVLLHNRSHANLLGMLMAGSAFAIDYSQEAKGYALVSALALASTLAWLRLLHNPHTPQRPVRSSLTYALCTAAMLGTHYFAAPLLGMQWVVALINVGGLGDLRRLRDVLSQWWPLVRAQTLACVPVVLWIGLAWRGIIAGGAKAANAPAGFHPIEVLSRIWGEFGMGRYMAEWMIPIAAIALVSCWLIGLIVVWRRGLQRAFWLCASVVIALLFAEVIAPRLSIFYPRFLLWALPLVLLPITQLMTLRRWFGVTFGVAIALPLLSLYTSPIDPQTDYRPLFAELRKNTRAGDVALGTYIWMDGMAASYAPETIDQLIWVRDFYQQDGSDIDPLMQPLQQRTQRIWHFNFERSPDDPATLSALWLRQHGAEVQRWQQGNLTVVLFDPTAPTAIIDSQSSTFGDQLSVAWSPIPADVQPGDSLRVNLQWRALTRPEALGISLQWLGPEGALIAQRDQDAVNGLSPTLAWQPDQVIVDARALLIPPDAPPGDYTLQLVVYRRADGQRLRLASGAPAGADAQILGVVRVTSPRDNPALR